MSDINLKELLKKLRNYEIRIRKAVNQQMHGDFHSVFKGSGLEFDDIREYQYGDDVRTIDWNVTAKGHGTYIKTFKEEKEQTVFFLLDVSASQDIGREGMKKIDIAKEILGVLALSALREQNNVGVFCFSDTKEKYIKPGKGMKFAYELISLVYRLKPLSLKTDINKALSYVLNLVKRRSVVILISDFIDENYDKNIKALANKHDLVVIQLSDRREAKLPRLGIIPVFDKENKKTIWINTSSSEFRNNITHKFNLNKNLLQDICKKSNSSYLQIFNNEDYVNKLIKLFQVRK
ncbi:MAG: DUF58 domain-containing protein [Cytophagales bacterium]|nr:MAG: DUF58 domain-containing protein [Cytophagales bacterium]